MSLMAGIVLSVCEVLGGPCGADLWAEHRALFAEPARPVLPFADAKPVTAPELPSVTVREDRGR